MLGGRGGVVGGDGPGDLGPLDLGGGVPQLVAIETDAARGGRVRDELDLAVDDAWHATADGLRPEVLELAQRGRVERPGLDSGGAELAQAPAHLSGGAVGEGDGQHAGGLEHPGTHAVGDAVGDRPGLARRRRPPARTPDRAGRSPPRAARGRALRAPRRPSRGPAGRGWSALLLSHGHAARSPETAEQVVHRQALAVVLMRQAPPRSGGPGVAGCGGGRHPRKGMAGLARTFHSLRPRTPQTVKERQRYAGHCDDVQHHVVRLLPSAEEPDGPRGHHVQRDQHRARPGVCRVRGEGERGNQTVPTVLFPDGSTLTNPSLAQVKQKIGA